MDEDLQKELTWASGALVAFLILLVYGGLGGGTLIPEGDSGIGGAGAGIVAPPVVPSF